MDEDYVAWEKILTEFSEKIFREFEKDGWPGVEWLRDTVIRPFCEFLAEPMIDFGHPLADRYKQQRDALKERLIETQKLLHDRQREWFVPKGLIELNCVAITRCDREDARVPTGLEVRKE